MKSVVTSLIVLGIGAIVAIAQRAELKQMLNGRRDESLSVSSPLGPLLLAVRDISLAGNYPDGRPLKSGVLVLYDPSSHCFFWERSVGVERPYEFRGGFLTAFAEKELLTVFRVMDRDIYVKKSDEKAASLDDAESKAIEGARVQLGAHLSRQWYGWQTIPFGRKLANDEFFVPKGSAMLDKLPTLVELSRHAGGWEIVLQCQWKERITLNDKYDVIKLERVP